MAQATVWTPLPAEKAASICGEGVHTALRKGTNAPGAHKAWRAIADMDSDGWSDAMAWFVWSLDYMGMAICTKEKKS